MDSLNIIILDENKELEFLKEEKEINKIVFVDIEKDLFEKIEKKSFDTCIINSNFLNKSEKIIKKILSKKIPILIALEKHSDIENIINALSNGAFDYFNKPKFNILNNFDKKKIIEHIIIKLIFAEDSKSKIKTEKNIIKEKFDFSFNESSKKLIVIGSSTGGPQSLEKIIPLIPKEIPSPIIIIQHMPEEFTVKLAERLDNLSEIEVKETKENEELKDGICYVCKGNHHLKLKKINNKIVFSLNQKEKIHGIRPSIDITMQSASNYYGKNLIGIILTGMGTDGTIGTKKIKEKGGTVIVQSEKTSIIYGMPKSVIENENYDEIVDLDKIPIAMLQILEV